MAGRLVGVVFVPLFGRFGGGLIVLAALVKGFVVSVDAGGLYGRGGIGAAQQVGETAEGRERAERAERAGLAEQLRERNGGRQRAGGRRARRPARRATLQIRLL